MRQCRVCGNPLYTKPLLEYENLPKDAQYMPEEVDIQLEKGIDLEIMQCSGCGVVQLNCEPVHYYREVIRATAVSSEMRAFRENQLSKFIEQYQLENKKAIEIACGKGEYLEIIAEQPIDVYGIEYNAESVNICSKKGLKVQRGFLEKSNTLLHEGPFDVFFIFNYLEHVPNPNVFLRAIYNNLTEDGIGMIEVPNFDMILKENMFSEFITDHLIYYTRDTLRLLLEMNGFQIIEYKDIWDDYIISVIIRKRKAIDVNSFKDKQHELIKEVKAYVKQKKGKNIAIWGAGHQALTILALGKLDEEVECVIDSSKFKQGKFTQATHIPIVPPESIIEGKIKAILVIAGGFSDEIANSIIDQYLDIDVAIVRKNHIEIIR